MMKNEKKDPNKDNKEMRRKDGETKKHANDDKGSST